MKRKGSSAMIFDRPPVIFESACTAGKKESEGPLGTMFDQVWSDDHLGMKTWEEAESRLQEEAVKLLFEKAKLPVSEIDYFFAGDLLGQIIASSFGLENFRQPVFGLYGACSTIGEALILSSVCLEAGGAKKILAITSSHFASAERQFRFPLGYGNQRPLSATWTVTGSAAFIIACPDSHDSEKIKEKMKHCPQITAAIPGRIVDMNVRDSMNMGACMAPAAADTIETYFRDTGDDPMSFDHIITGDLGYVGRDILLEIMQKKGFDIGRQHMDCGIEIFDRKKQDTHSGGSGCACSALVLSSMILPRLQSGEWKKVLFMPTGALLSQVSFNEGKGVPGIAHGVVIESAGN